MSEISQTQKGRDSVTPLYEVPRRVRSIETGSRWGGPGAGGGEVKSLMRAEFRFGKMRKFWRYMVGMVVQHKYT